MIQPILSILIVFCVAGCGQPVAVSDYVSLKLSGVKEGDVKNGHVSEDKNINTEEGNPYAAFLRHVSEELEGQDPSVIEVDSLALHVHGDSKGIVNFESLFENMEVFITTSDTTVTLGVMEGPVGSTVYLEDILNENLSSVQTAMMIGAFGVGVRGLTQELVPDDFDLKMSLDIQFSAYP